jgi:ssRNA-specific RNase YbeY (16S rRNA maturation enzyme)
MIEMTAKCTGGEQHSDALQDRISLLLIHGILHLFGSVICYHIVFIYVNLIARLLLYRHDHETDNDWARMTSREEELISALTNSDVWNHRLD